MNHSGGGGTSRLHHISHQKIDHLRPPPLLINIKKAYEQQQDQDSGGGGTSRLHHISHQKIDHLRPPPLLINVKKAYEQQQDQDNKHLIDSTYKVSNTTAEYGPPPVSKVRGGYHAVHLETEPTDAATQRLWHADGQSIINIQESGIASITSLQTPSPWLVPPNSVPQPPPPPGVGAGGESYQHVVGESSGIAGMGPGGIDRFQTMSSSIPGMNGE